MSQPEAVLSDPVVEQIIRAAAVCVARDGYDGMTMNGLIQESGVPRTTIYRKVGGPGAILRTLLNWLSLPRIAICEAIAMGPGSLSDRITRVIASNIVSVGDHPWLHAMLRKGVSHDTLDLFSTMNMDLSRRVLRPMLEAAAQSGAWTPPASIDVLLDWVMRQTLLLGGEERLDEMEMRETVRIFVVPVFGFDRATSSLETRLAAVEARLEEPSPKPVRARVSRAA